MLPRKSIKAPTGFVFRDTDAFVAKRKAKRQAAIAIVRATPSTNAASRGLQLARGEWKSLDVAGSMAADTTGSVQLLNGCARGDDINMRNGRMTVMRSISLAGTLEVTAGTGVDQVQRFLIVLDKQANGAPPGVTGPGGVLETVGAGYLPYAHPNLENRNRFVILFDSGPVVLNASGEPGSKVPFRYKKYVYMPVTFNGGNAGTVADIVTGSIYAVTVGTVAPGATAGGNYFRSRIRYEDK